MISDHASPIADLGGVDSGGQNVYVAQLSTRLARLGNQVDIFTRKDRPDQPEILEWQTGIRIIFVPAGPAEFVPKEELSSYLDDFSSYVIDFFQSQPEPYHLVHANFWMSAVVATEIKRVIGTPFVVTFHALGKVRRIHQGQNDGFPDSRFLAEEIAIKEASSIIAECPQEKEDLLQLYNADPSKIVIIPGGFDPEEMCPVDKRAAREELNLPENEHIVLQLGRMVPRKGVDNAIRGFARLVKTQNISGRLVIVGGASDQPDFRNDPEMRRLRSIAAKEGISDLVIFAGRKSREMLKFYYGAADVFVTTPWYEPFGITPVEAMACGTPVIGSNVGGIKYTILDGETGYLIPPNDPDTLSQRLAYLLSKPKTLKKMSEQAILRANSFTWDKVSELTNALYTSIKNAEREISSRALGQMEIIANGFQAAIESMQLAHQNMAVGLYDAAETLTQAFISGNKVMICGNGGSAADAQHFATELVGRFIEPTRKALPALALTADSSFLTAWANDISYDQVFARQVEAFGKPGDILIGISTSGMSNNIINAFQTAQQMGIYTMGILGHDGGELLTLSNLPLVVPVESTPRIQEVHILLIHLLCELIENALASTRGLYIQPAKKDTAWNIETGIPVPVPGSKDFPLLS